MKTFFSARQNNKRKGFALVEMLVVVVILAVLAGISVPSIARVKKTMHQSELDAKAETIYSAVQNRLIQLMTAGQTEKFNYDYDDNTAAGILSFGEGSYAYTTSLLRSAATDATKGVNAIMTDSTVDSDILSNAWVIEFYPDSAVVKAVFYSEDTIRVGSTDYTSVAHYYSPDADISAIRGGNSSVGYYAGNAASDSSIRSNKVDTLTATLNISNGETLEATMSCTAAKTPVFKVQLWNGTDGGTNVATAYYTYSSDNTETIAILNENDIEVDAKNLVQQNGNTYTLTLTLDALETGKHFHELYPTLTPGESLSIAVTPMIPGDHTSTDSITTAAVTNSLFADASTADTAVLLCARHLQNLDKTTSGVMDTITTANQQSDIIPGTFTPITNGKLTTYNGNNYRITGLTVSGVDNGGLFATVENGKLTINGVIMTGTSVVAEDNAGALVGEAQGNLEINGCQVYLTEGDIAAIEETKKNEHSWISGGNAGGLVGSAKGSLTIKDSAASTVVKATDSAGGLVGTASSAVSIETSYADGYLTGATAGGLVGTAIGTTTTLTNAYAAGYLTYTGTGAGLIAGPAIMTNTYTVMAKLGTSGVTYYSTATGGTATNTHYWVKGTSLSAGTTRITTPEALAAALNTEDFTTEGGKTLYNLTAQDSEYTLPTLVGLHNYGDWSMKEDAHNLSLQVGVDGIGETSTVFNIENGTTTLSGYKRPDHDPKTDTTGEEYTLEGWYDSLNMESGEATGHKVLNADGSIYAAVTGYTRDDNGTFVFDMSTDKTLYAYWSFYPPVVVTPEPAPANAADPAADPAGNNGVSDDEPDAADGGVTKPDGTLSDDTDTTLWQRLSAKLFGNDEETGETEEEENAVVEPGDSGNNDKGNDNNNKDDNKGKDNDNKGGGGSSDPQPTTTYYLYYNANGGTGAPTRSAFTRYYYYYYYATVSSAAPTRSGYTFLGWSTSPTATEADYKSGDTYWNYYYNNDVTLYAVWKANSSSGTSNIYRLTDTIKDGKEYVIVNTNSAKQYATMLLGGNNLTTTSVEVKYNSTAGYYYVENPNSSAVFTAEKYSDYRADRFSLRSTQYLSVKNYSFKIIANNNNWTEYWYTSYYGVLYNAVYTGWNTGYYIYEKVDGCTVTLDSNDGTPTATQSATVQNSGTALTYATDYTQPAKTGYTFDGWTLSANSDTLLAAANGDLEKSVTDYTDADGKWIYTGTAVTLYAHWTPITYTVVYNGNGATGGSTDSSEHTYDVDKALTQNGFERVHTVTFNTDSTESSFAAVDLTAEFNGWATTAGGAVAHGNGETVNNLTTIQGGTVNLYAKWNLDSVTLPNPTKTGYIFDGWYLGGTKEGGAGDSYTPTANIELTAHWAAINYTVVYDGNGATGGDTAPTNHTYGTDSPLATNGFEREYTVTFNAAGGSLTPTTAKATARFDGWAETATGDAIYTSGQTNVKNLTTTQNGEVRLYAKWTLGTVEELPTPTREGYTFTGWYNSDGERIDDAGKSYTPTADIELTAHWTLNKYDLKIHYLYKNGKKAKDDHTEQIDFGAKYSVVTDPITGYTADKNTVTGTMPAETVEVTVTYTPNSYTVVFDPGVGGGGTMANQSFTYDTAQNLNINTFTGPSYQVTYLPNGGTVTPESETVTASFKDWTGSDGKTYENQDDVENLTTEENGTVTLTANWKPGTVKLPTPTREGYTFTGWYNSDGEKIDDAGDSYTPTADIELTAHWTAYTYTVRFDPNGANDGSMTDMTYEHDETRALTANAFTRVYTVTFDSNGGTVTAATGTAIANFNGWALAPDGGVVYTDKEEVKNLTTEKNGTVTLYANWTLGSVTLPSATKKGYTFDGWYSGNTKIGDAGESYTPTKNIELTAHYTEIPKEHTFYNGSCTLTLDANGGTFGTDTTTLKLTAAYHGGLSTDNYALPTRAGYTLSGWCLKGTETAILNLIGEATSLVKSVSGYTDEKGFWIYNGNAKIEAQWTPVSFTVKLHPTGTTDATAAFIGSAVYEGKTLKDGDDVTYADFLKTVTKTGYDLTGWFTAENGGEKILNADATLVADKTVEGYIKGGSWFHATEEAVELYAQWTPKTTTVKLYVDSGEYRTATATYGNGTLTYTGTDYSAPEKTGYTFLGWFTAEEGGSQLLGTDGCFLTTPDVSGYLTGGTWVCPDATVTLYAHWQANTYTLNLHSDDAAATLQQSFTETYQAQATTAGYVKPADRTGYTFHGWYTQKDGKGSLLVKPDGTFAPNLADYTATGTDGVTRWIWATTDTVDVYAYWSVNTYTITLMQGTDPYNSVKVNYGSDINLNAYDHTYEEPVVVGNNYGWYDSNDVLVVNADGKLERDVAGYTTGINWTHTDDVTLFGRATPITTVFTLRNGTADYLKGTVAYDSSAISYTAPTSGAAQNYSAPTKTGYALDGWFTAENGGTKIILDSGALTPLATDYTDNSGKWKYYNTNSTPVFYAQWSYTVTYDLNGAPADSTFAVQSAKLGGNVTLYGKTPVREGYTFQGWYNTATEDTTYQPGDTYTDNGTAGNVTLRATWEQITYKVEYDANGGSGKPTDQTKKYGEALTLSSVIPTKTGYDFLGWSTVKDGTVVYPTGQTNTYTTNAALKLYAVWQLKTYTITYLADTDDATLAGMPTDKTSKSHFDTGFTLSTAVPTRDKFIFKGWSVDENDSVEYAAGAVYAGTADLTLHAVWQAKAHKLILQSGTGDDARTWEYADVTAGTTKPSGYTNPTHVPANNYTLEGWYTSQDSGGVKILEADGSVVSGSNVTGYTENGQFKLTELSTTLYAKWTYSVYVLTDDYDGEGNYMLVDANASGTGYAVGVSDTNITANEITILKDGQYDNKPYIKSMDNTIIWSMKKPGSYYTLQNNATGKYLRNRTTWDYILLAVDLTSVSFSALVGDDAGSDLEYKSYETAQWKYIIPENQQKELYFEILDIISITTFGRYLVRDGDVFDTTYANIGTYNGHLYLYKETYAGYTFEDNLYTLNFESNGVTEFTAHLTENGSVVWSDYSGTAPTPTAPSSLVSFYGWTLDNADTKTAPEKVQLDGALDCKSLADTDRSITLYACWNATNLFVKTTDLSEGTFIITNGNYALLNSARGNNTLNTNYIGVGSGNSLTSAGITYNLVGYGSDDNTTLNNSYLWTTKASGSGYTIQSVGSGSYLVANATCNKYRYTNTYYWDAPRLFTGSDATVWTPIGSYLTTTITDSTYSQSKDYYLDYYYSGSGILTSRYYELDTSGTSLTFYKLLNSVYLYLGSSDSALAVNSVAESYVDAPTTDRLAEIYTLTLMNGTEAMYCDVESGCTAPEGYVMPERDDATLKGWFTQPEGGAMVLYADGSVVPNVEGWTDEYGLILTGDITLYAQWEEPEDDETDEVDAPEESEAPEEAPEETAEPEEIVEPTPEPTPEFVPEDEDDVPDIPDA